MVAPARVAHAAVLGFTLAALLEPHAGVVTDLDRALAQDERDAGDDEQRGRHYRRDHELVVGLVEGEARHDRVGVRLGEEAREARTSVVVSAVLAVLAQELAALVSQRVDAALQVDEELALVSDEEIELGRSDAAVLQRLGGEHAQVREVREVSEVSERVLLQY